MISIKRLNKKDLELMKELLLFFQSEDGVKNPRTATPKRLVELLEDGNFYILVAFDKAQIVGGLTAYHLKMYKGDYGKVILYEINVKSTFKRKRIGKRMIAELKNIAAIESVQEILLVTSKNNLEASQFYEATGGERLVDSILFKYSLDN